MIDTKRPGWAYELRKQWTAATKAALDRVMENGVPTEGHADGDVAFLIGNLPMPCPNCGRARLDLDLVAWTVQCGKCDATWPARGGS